MGWVEIQYGIQDGCQIWKILKFFNYDFTRIMMALDFFLVHCGQHYGCLSWKWILYLILRSKRQLMGELSVYGAILKGTWRGKMRVYYLTAILYITKPKIIKIKQHLIYFIFCSRTMTAFYSIQFTVITSKISVNQMPRHCQTNLLFHQNITAPILAMCFGIYKYTHSIHCISFCKGAKH